MATRPRLTREFCLEAGRLATYRIYHVGQGGRLRLGESLQARTDEEAAAVARDLLSPGHAAELWEGGRMVGRFSPSRDFLPGAG